MSYRHSRQLLLTGHRTTLLGEIDGARGTGLVQVAIEEEIVTVLCRVDHRTVFDLDFCDTGCRA